MYTFIYNFQTQKYPTNDVHHVSIPGNIWRKVHGQITRRPTNFSWVILDTVAGSGFPTSRAEVEWLRQQGVRGIISMTERSLPKDWTDDISYLHLPTVDMTAPTRENIDIAMEFMHEHVKNSEPVMVHCAAGLGRAGTILACYLVKYHDKTASEAIVDLRRIRPGSVQSKEQEIAVHMYSRT